MKRLLAMLLCLILAVSMLTACGDDDDDKDSKKTVKIESVEDALDALSDEDLSTGSVTIAYEIEEGDSKLKAEIYTAVNGEDMSFGLSFEGDVEGTDLDVDAPELLIIKDGSLFVNLGAIAEIGVENADVDLSDYDIDTKDLAWFEIPLPDDLELTAKGNEKIQDAFLDLAKDLIACGDEDGTTVTFDKADQLKKAVEVLADFMEKDFADLLEDALKDGGDLSELLDIDVNKYVKKLIDFYYDDICKVCTALGVDTEAVDTYIDQIESMDLQEYYDEYLEQLESMDSDELLDELDTEDAVAELREAAEELDDSEEFSFEFSADVSGSVYSFDAELEAEITDEETNESTDGTLKMSVDFDASKPSIKAPADTCRIGDFADSLSSLLSLLMYSSIDY